MYELVFLTGGRAGQVVPVTRTLVAGRSPECSLVVPDPNASRQHCTFIFDGGSVVIADKASANGTFLNEVRLTEPVTLNDGDEVRLGQSRLRFNVKHRNEEEAPRDATIFAFRETATEDDDDPYGKSISVSMTELPRRALTEKAILTRLNAIIKVSKALVNIRDFDSISRGILDALFEVFPQADRGFLMLGNDVGSLAAQAVKSRGKSITENLVVSKSICRSALEQRRAILFNDTGAQDFTPGQSIYALQIRSAMVVPLMVNEEILGLLQIDTPDRSAAFTAEDLELALAVSQQAAIALHNASLLRKVEQETTNRNNLMRFLPGGMVEQVLSGKIDLALGGRTCEGTILFSDVVGFTRLSENLHPEQVVAMMNGYFSRMVPCIEDRGGAVDKFMGDAIMAVWGVPIPKPASAQRAGNAALSMQNAMVGFNSLQGTSGWPLLEMGIGLNSGMVVAGNIGADNRVSYTVLGDTVNTSQRLESSAGRGQVLVSENTWMELLGNGYGIAMPPLRVKNKASALLAFSLRGLKTPEGEIVLHLRLKSGRHPVWIIRRLVDETFIVLHPEEALATDQEVVTDIAEWPSVVLGRPRIEEVLPAQASDGIFVRSQISLPDPTLRGLIGPAPLACELSWEQMTRQ